MSNVNALEALAHPDFFETVDRYKPRLDDFFTPVQQLVPQSWRFRRNGIWFGCYPPESVAPPIPLQGWKIHLSTTTGAARRLLEIAVPLLSANQTGFKFSLDLRLLSLMNSKQWMRQSAGKFVTIYPSTDDDFVRLIASLHDSTRSFVGPYILSDRRYKDSRVVYYRYGGMSTFTAMSSSGELTHVLRSPSGNLEPDRRLPYFVMPSWVQDPFATGHDDEGSSSGATIILKQGRYHVHSVIRHSNSGGVYLADDLSTGHRCIIKEARPFVETTEDATTLLRKEHRLLTAVSHLGIAPQPLDIFEEWEHVFLVEEFIDGVDLSHFAARRNIALRPSADLADAILFHEQFKKIFLQVSAALQALHQMGIVFGDLSPSNVLVSRDESLRVTFIDFEAAHQDGVDAPVRIFTTGFTDRDRLAGQNSTQHGDVYALGALMHHFLWPINQVFGIDPQAWRKFLPEIIADIGFPTRIVQLIAELLGNVVEQPPAIVSIAETLSERTEILPPWRRETARHSREQCLRDVGEIARFTKQMMSHDRRDRLFPADGTIFRTNPLSVAYGACGVACVLKRVTGSIEPSILSWICEASGDLTRYPPGLYTGLAGIAWVLLELGLRDDAERVMQATYSHALRHEAYDIYSGMAGWGLAALRFYLSSREREHLRMATDAGERLLESRIEERRGAYWSIGEEVPIGYAHGASGIAQFLLYLHLATDRADFLSIGLKALDFDLSNGTETEDGVSWRRYAGKGSIVYPYWRYGSAGIGTAVLRYYRFTKDERYVVALEHAFKDTKRKYSVLPGFFKGLAGKGEFLLDMYRFTQQERYLDAAHVVASGVALFGIRRPEGLAFPGETLRRISCDYGTGSAGVAHFLHRLAFPDSVGLFNLDDELLEAV